MSIVKITTHLSNAIARLFYNFQGRPGVEGLIYSQANQIQEMENAGFDFFYKLALQTASGAVLDRWGFVLDESRLGDNDSDYRSRLFFKVSRNISNGTPEEMIQIFAGLVQASNVQITEVFPGAVVLTAVNAQNPANPALVRSQLQQILPAAVRIEYLALGNDEHPFAFASHPNLNARGFDIDPVQGIGGVFVSIF